MLFQSEVECRLNMIKNMEKFLWNEEIEQDFIELKRAFTEGGKQAFPDFWVGELFVLTTNWSKENITGPGRAGEIPWVLGKKV